MSFNSVLDLTQDDDPTLLINIEDFDVSSTTMSEITTMLPDSPTIERNRTPTDVDHRTTQSFGSVANNRNTRKTRWLITTFSFPNGYKPLNPNIFTASQVTSFAGQYEICPTTNRIHAHIFVIFKSPGVTFAHIQNKIRIYFGDDRCQIKYIGATDDIRTFNYCSKERTRAEDMKELNCYYNRPSRAASTIRRHNSVSSARSARTTTTNTRPPKVTKQDLYDFLIAQPDKGWYDIFHDTNTPQSIRMAMWGSSLEKTWDTIRERVLPRNIIEQVIILYGAAGSGKTTYAKEFDEPSKTYTKCRSTGKWFSGIAFKHTTLIVEEMDGRDIGIGTFLELTNLGHQAPTVEVKSSTVQGNWKNIIITSNRHPLTWYKQTFLAEPERWKAFARRITKCIYYPPTRDDGTPNRWTPETPAQFEEENLLDIDATHGWMGIAYQKTNMDFVTGNNEPFQTYVNRML